MQDENFIIERKILHIGNHLVTTRSEDLKRFGLTPSQSETLLFFDAHPGALIADLKTHLRISHQAARNLVERMKAKGLLEGTVSPADGRARQVRLTDQGRATCDRLKATGASVGRALLEGLTPQEKQTLDHLLDKISENL